MDKELVVIDTNVFLSALKSNLGFSHKLVSEIGTEKFDIAISVPLVLEYESILKKFLDRNIYTDYKKSSKNAQKLRNKNVQLVG